MSVAEIEPEESARLIPENERPLLVDPTQMALILGVSKTTLYRWSFHPDCPVHRHGHLVLYPWREMAAWVLEAIKNKDIILPGRNDLPPKAMRAAAPPPKAPRKKRA